MENWYGHCMYMYVPCVRMVFAGACANRENNKNNKIIKKSENYLIIAIVQKGRGESFFFAVVVRSA